MKDPQVQTAIRVPKSYLKRADKLASEMSQPGVRPFRRSDALRLALFEGLKILESKPKETA